MIKNTSARAVSQIFTNDKNIFYQIPKYQREYTWGKKEWDLLFNDILENEKGYFLGSIICVDKSPSSYEDTILEIIDGQQRITTLSILLLSIYCKLLAHKNELDEDQKGNLNRIKRELIIKKDKATISRLTLQAQNNNQADYLSLLADCGLITAHKSNYAGIRRIYKAFGHFNECISKYVADVIEDDPNQNEIAILFSLSDKFNASILVNIEVETNRDAYMLFESLNNRGIPLSAIDLIKNLLISVSDKDGKAEECYEVWKNILSYLGEEYSEQERFFRYYYDTYRDKLNAPYQTSGKQKYALGYVATKSNLIDIYEKLIKNNYNAFLDNIKAEAKTYSILTNNNKNDAIPELEVPLLNLKRIQGSPAYILLMYLLSNKDKLELNNRLIKDTIEYLISYFVRRNITDYPNTRNLVKIFMDTVDIAKNNKGNDIYTKITEYLKVNSSSDNIFKEKLAGPIYQDNPDATRFLLCYYEDYFKTKEIYTDLWERDNNKKYIWTIEHIFPEGENIPNCWVEMIANGDRTKAKEYLNSYAHTLGNLTITGYNSSLSNLSFEQKRDRQDKKGNEIGYKNGLKLNEDVFNQKTWKVEDIENRTKKLTQFFMEHFKI